MTDLSTNDINTGIELGFDNLSWRNITIHAMAFNTSDGDLLLDIDYIHKMIKPSPPSRDYRFYVAPSTLVFHNVSGFEADICLYSVPCVIKSLSRDLLNGIPSPKTMWVMSIGMNGRISFMSSGFDLHYRREPTLLDSDKFRLSLSERGGFSFNLGIEAD